MRKILGIIAGLSTSALSTFIYLLTFHFINDFLTYLCIGFIGAIVGGFISKDIKVGFLSGVLAGLTPFFPFLLTYRYLRIVDIALIIPFGLVAGVVGVIGAWIEGKYTKRKEKIPVQKPLPVAKPLEVSEPPSISKPLETSELPPSPTPSVTIQEAPQYVKEIEKYRNAISVLDSQFAIKQVGEESYRMAKASLEKKLQDLLKLKEDVTGVRKHILELIENKGSIGKADIQRDVDVSSEIVDLAFRQLENDGIIEETSGKRYKYKGITKQCTYCRRSIPADLPVCPLCGAIIE